MATPPSLSTQTPPSQTHHRNNLIKTWSLTPSSHILEIGCGQGDTTLALATHNGPHGHIDALDPGPPDYGSPLTLSQSQSLILSSPLGATITFHSTFPSPYLASYTGKKYDYIILSHSIWYFENPSVLPDLLKDLEPHIHERTKLCIAEWALCSVDSRAVPHVLTALLLSSLETMREVPSRENIRTTLSPAQIKSAVLGIEGLRLEKEEVIKAPEWMQDGYWEVSSILRNRGKEEDWVRKEKGDEVASAVQGWLDAIQMGVDGVGGFEGVRCMDVWVGVFGRE